MRQRLPEIMDDPSLPEVDHRNALDGLARLNAASGSVRVIWRHVQAPLRAAKGPISILDVATGGGDIPIGLWHLGEAAGVSLEITGADVSDTALSFADERAQAAGADIEWRLLDALRDPLPPSDVVTCSLFLHHLDDADAAALLRRLGAAARRRLIVSDLVRGPVASAMVTLAARLVCRSPVVHVDAVRSARAAFNVAELRELAMAAGLHEATVVRSHPCRHVLVWDRSP